MVFAATQVTEKLQLLPKILEAAMNGDAMVVPDLPGRDAEVLPPERHPLKKGLSYREGQARLLHDLASIELQAMELALRTLIEYPQAPAGFRDELYHITLSEASHLHLCLDGLKKLGFQWGQWPVHLGLWSAVDKEDALLDRILIVHRYLEGSGLDAGDTLLRRLAGVAESAVHPIVKTIFNDEIGHVEFGSRWYREVCRIEHLDAAEDFAPRMDRIFHKVPARIEKISHAARAAAGFTQAEIQYLENRRELAITTALQKSVRRQIELAPSST